MRGIALFPLVVVVNFIRSASRHVSGLQHKVKYYDLNTKMEHSDKEIIHLSRAY
jgi:hypothetical protein